MSNDVIVIGGGAAGLMAACSSARLGSRVLVLEKNEKMGRKLRITGKGRCNVTNNCTADEVIASVPTGGRFLYSALAEFPPQSTMAFFEAEGIPLKTERGQRVFPVSDKADDIADALVHAAKAAGVRFEKAAVTKILTESGAVIGVKTQSGAYYRAKRVLVACGGASYPGTGSNGDGCRLARGVGHTIKPLVPSLVPLVERGTICNSLMGLSLRNCKLWVTQLGKKKPVFADFGELLFTHFGLSGPTVLSASAHLRPMEPGKYTVHIDLKPALEFQKLDARILRDFSENQNRIFANSLGDLLPQKLIPVVIQRSKIPGETRCHSVTKEQRQGLCSLLKDFTIEIEGFRPINEAIVTSGGVNLKEIDPKTMQSKLVGGLYFAGEVLDCDAYTGGFNLQIAFATGHLAGEAMANAEPEE